jgi:hypothetical protein
MLSRSFFKRAARVLGAVPDGIVLDAATLELVAELDVGGRHGDIVAGARGAWFSTYEKRSLTYVGPDGETLVHAELAARPEQVTLDGQWPLVRCANGHLLRVEPESGRVVADVPAPPETSAVAVGDGRVWVLIADEGDAHGWRLALAQLDRATLAVTSTIALGRSRFFGNLTVADGLVNVLYETPDGMAYATFDAATGAARPTPAALTRPVGIGVHDGVRFVHADGKIRRLDADTGEELAVDRLPVPRAGGFVLAHDRLWALAWPRASRHDSESVG